MNENFPIDEIELNELFLCAMCVDASESLVAISKLVNTELLSLTISKQQHTCMIVFMFCGREM